jgi:Tfp pilus assembly protein PilE
MKTQEIVLWVILSGIVGILLAIIYQAWKLYHKLKSRKANGLCIDLLLNENQERRHWHEMWQNASQENNLRKEMYRRLDYRYMHLVKRHEQLKERYKGQRLHAENLQARLDARISEDLIQQLLLNLTTLERFNEQGYKSAVGQTLVMMRQAIENDLKNRQ